MNTIITISKKTLAFLIISLLSVSLSFAQTVPLSTEISVPPASTSCTSGDLELAEAKVTGGDACNTCVEGTQLTKTLTLSIKNTTGSTRGAFAFWGTLEIYSGVTGLLISSTTKTGCGGPLPGGSTTSLDFGTVTYNCGDILKFTNLWGAWTTPSVSCPLDPNNISPKCGNWGTRTVNAGVNGTSLIVNSVWNGATGSIDLTPSGGTAPYTYSWTSSDGLVTTGQRNSEDLTNIPPGTYTVVITDSQGCTATKIRTVTALYPPPAVFAPIADITVPCGGATTSLLSYTNGQAAPFLIGGSVTSTLSSQIPAGPCGGDIKEAWTFTDALNRTITASRIIHVLPATLPTMTAPADITVSCEAAVPAPSKINFSNGLTGGCLLSGVSGLSTFNTTVAGSCNGKVTETWTATDICGRPIASVSRIITIQDKTNPIITCPSLVSASANAGCAATGVVLGTPVTSDNCGIMSVVSVPSSTTFPIGITTVIWTATDFCGNTATCSQTVTVTDNTKPTVNVCAPPVSVKADKDACSASNVDLGAPTITDNCSSPDKLKITNNAPPTFPIGTTTVTWTIEDAAGNTETCSQTVTVTDDQQPIITACAIPVSVPADKGACTASNVNLVAPSFTDNCNAAQVTIKNNAPPVFPIGTTTVIWTIKDASGNTAICNQIVTVIDTQSPTITICPAPANISADNGACTASNVKLVAPTYTDNCNLAQATVTNNAPPVFPIGTTTVTWTVKDAANNTATCTQTVTVTDNQKPIVPILADVSGQCSATVTVPTTSDNCAGTIVATTTDPLVYNNQGTYTVHWTFDDGNGNSTIVNQKVIVDNKVPPSPPVLADVIGQCSATVSIPTVVNSCDHSSVPGTTPDPLSYTKQGTYTVHWTFNDGNGNIITANQKVIIADTVKPVIVTCAPVVNVTADTGLCSASNVSLGAPTASDNCTLNPLTITNDAPTVFPIGKTTITWTIKDISGNIATCTQIVTVTDSQKPIIVACAAPISVNADNGSCNASHVSLGNPPAFTDNCSLTEVTVTNDAPSVFPIGTTTVNWTIKDAAGNTVTCTQKVTVIDNQKPIITACAAPVDVPADYGACTASNVNLGAPNVSDNCTLIPLTVSNDAPTAFPIGTTTVTWTIKDGANNIAICKQTVTVTDNQKPTIVACAAPVKIAADRDACTASNVNIGSPNVSDNCTLVPLSVSNDAPATFPIGTTTVTWTIKDASNNIATCTQTVTVTDNQIPTIVACAGPVNVTTDKDSCSASNMNLGAPNVSDNCTLIPLSVSNDAPATFPIGTTTVTWTIKDAANNIATCKQTVTVTDNQIPTIVACALPVNVAADKDACSASNVNIGTPNVSDNCTLVPVSVSNDAPATFPIGITTVTWTIKDASGNIATCAQTVTVTDNQIPTIVACALPVNVTTDKDACSASNVNLGTPNVSDNCMLVSLSVSNDAPVAFPIGTTTVTWTIKDAANNIATCKQTVTVIDNQKPTVIACAAPVNVPADNGACTASAVNLGNPPTFTDNCNLSQMTVTNDAPSVFPIGTTTVTWTIKDASGNTTNCMQSVTVIDDQKPIISKLLADVIGQCSATVTAPTASDNCAGIITATTSDPLIYKEQGTFIVHWSFDDGNGNITTANQNVIVDNTIPPAAPELVDIIGQCSATASIPTVVNNCYPIVINGTTDDPLTYTEQGTFIIHWTFDDGNGNIITANQNVIIHDTTAPVLIEAPADVTVDCSAVPSASATDLTATDNCSVNPVVITFAEVKTNETCAGSYTLTRTWTATDASGNSSSKSQKITVQDTTAPVFTSELPADISASCDNIPTAEIMTAVDGCGSATVNLVETQTRTSDSCPGEYSLTRTWTASDACGNSTSHTQKINVHDTTAPVIAGTFQNITTVDCDKIPPIPQLEFSDNCSGIGEIIAPSSDDNIVDKTDDSYTIIRTWKVSDLCGNTSTFIQTINVNIKDAVSTVLLDACNEKPDTYNLNTLIPQEYVGHGIWKDMSNSGGLKGDNDGIFSPYGIPAGNYTMEYDINDPVCPRKIQITTNVNNDCKVLPCGNIIVHSFFSPNGDGYNDVFVIENINEFNCYPTNKVRIYNRWGALLFETEGYDNNEKAFRGISQAGATVDQAAELPSGTYFYVLEYTSDSQKNYKESGYLYLSR